MNELLTTQQFKKEINRMSDNSDKFKAVKGDREIAEELRKKFFEALTPVCELLGEASEVGFEVGFGFGKDAFGRTIIQSINLMKKY